MRRMGKWLAFLLALLLVSPLAAHAEMNWEIADNWYAKTEEITNFGTRQSGTQALKDAENYLRASFEAAGFSREDGTLIETAVQDSLNVEGVMPALNENPAIIVIGAHFDSNAPGARDNSSGVAAMLTLMELFQQRGPYEDTELRFVAFTLEEAGHFGSIQYAQELTEEEKERVLGMFNIDILTVDYDDTWCTAFSCDTLGMRTEDGYMQGSTEAPASNLPVRAIRKAMDIVGGYAEETEDVEWCVPRHWGMSDHESFHKVGIDAVNVCFRGNVAEGGSWPPEMHKKDEDVMGDFDLERTALAIETIYTAVDELASDHSFAN